MNRAVVIPWHQYAPQGITQHYRVYFDYFLKLLPLWKDEFDHMYIIDHQWNFGRDGEKAVARILGDRFTIKEMEGEHHWTHLENILPEIKEEKMLFMDQDAYVYQSGIVADYFKKLDKFDLITMFDRSGGMQDILWEKFPWLKENNYLRMGSYFLFVKTRLFDGLHFRPQYFDPGYHIEELDYTTKEGDWLDSFGLATIKVLAKNPKISVIPDDRGSVYLMENGEINDAYKMENTGCHHLRNWNLGLHLINEKKRDRESYEKFREITPCQEACRLLAWLWIIGGRKIEIEVLGIVKDYGVEKYWTEYIRRFKEFHSWI